jgi:hypothetical protein
MDALSFNQRLLLAILPIIVTALFAGFLIPWLLRIVDARKSESMKRYEAALSRQARIIDAQANLLDELTKAMWAWRYSLMRVTYAGAEQSDEALDTAWRAYNEQMWDSLHAIRVQITRSRRLVSQHAYSALLKQYEQIVDVDRRLGAAMRLPAAERRRDLEELNLEVFTRVSAAIDASLHMVAEEVRLVSPESRDTNAR